MFKIGDFVIVKHRKQNDMWLPEKVLGFKDNKIIGEFMHNNYKSEVFLPIDIYRLLTPEEIAQTIAEKIKNGK